MSLRTHKRLLDLSDLGDKTKSREIVLDFHSRLFDVKEALSGILGRLSENGLIFGHFFFMSPSRPTAGSRQRVRHAPEGRLCHRVLGGSRRRRYNWLLHLTTGENQGAYVTQGGC